jgi:hypothetical protein
MANLVWLVIILAVVGLLWQRRLDAKASRAKCSRPVTPPGDLASEAQDFLDVVDRDLGLPPDVRADVRAELAAHLSDSISAIEAEGLDESRATREALARLGSPQELARSMRAAHQTARRLLAGAAGGVFQAGVGAVQGYILFTVLIFLPVILIGTPLRPLVNLVADHLPAIGQPGLETGSAFAALVSVFVVFAAGRRSVRALTRGSRRTDAGVRRGWALAGFCLLAWLILFVNTAVQSWVVVLLELVIPFAWVAGALFRGDRSLLPGEAFVPRYGGYLVALALPVMIVATLAGAVVNGSSGGDDGDSYHWSTTSLELVAPAWPSDVAASDSLTWGQPAIEASWSFQDETRLSQFRDLRIELWRGARILGAPDYATDFLPDPAYSIPFAIRPVEADREVSATFDVSHVRTTRWTVFLTGVAPGGIRYRLTGAFSPSTTSSFSGTVWDWLTAAN